MKGKGTYYMILLAGLLAAASAAPATEVIEGELGPGALYLMAVPDAWNGDLVLYAHGVIDAEQPVALPTLDYIEPLRDLLLANGFAVAYSSYSENGFAVKDGAQRTKQLRGVFADLFGKPDRTFLLGHSLGAAVGLKLVETQPKHYDGLLAVSGMVGGSQAEIDYIANLRVLWELFYPGVLPGDVNYVPPGVDLMTEVVYPIIGAISADPTGAVVISMIDQTPVPYTNPTELVEAFARGLGFYFRGYADLVDRTHGATFFDNTETVYTGLLPPDDLAVINAYAARLEATPDAVNYLEHNYQPSGDLGVPVLTLHTMLDPSVPVFHEALLAEAAAAQGCGDMLVQRTFARYGHTEAILPDEILAAFLELVEWADTGVAPVP